jgi:hypothetical protein
MLAKWLPYLGRKVRSMNRGQSDDLEKYVSGPIFTHQLDYTGGPGLIDRLADKGRWYYKNNAINDDRYPSPGEGIVEVGFRVLAIGDPSIPCNQVFKKDVDAAFRKKKMRRPKPAEALLFLAENPGIGRGMSLPLVAILWDSADVLIASEYYIDEPDLDLASSGDGWSAGWNFLGVCE